MSEQTGPFLSAATLRRIMAIHPFSEANRNYLNQEAERREQWEQELDHLLEEVMPAPGKAVPSRVPPRGMADADITHSHS